MSVPMPKEHMDDMPMFQKDQSSRNIQEDSGVSAMEESLCTDSEEIHSPKSEGMQKQQSLSLVSGMTDMNESNSNKIMQHDIKADKELETPKKQETRTRVMALGIFIKLIKLLLRTFY